MSEAVQEQSNLTVNVRIREFGIPPVQDALVLGRGAPIGAEAMKRAVTLLHVAQFEMIETEDPVVEAVIVRASILRKIPRDRLLDLVLMRVKPFMAKDEVMLLDVSPELALQVRV